MNIIEISCAAAFILSSGVFASFGWRALKYWREVREELFFHFMMTFFAISVLFLAFFSVLCLSITLDIRILFIIGIFYDLFYLEISFIYLSLFPNTRRIIEKYIPFVIAGALLMNIIASSANDEYYNRAGTALHVVVVSIGLFLLIRTVIKLRNSEKYFRKPEEISFIKFSEKILIFTIFSFILDGAGFFAWYYFVEADTVVTDLHYAVFGIGTVFFAVAIYYTLILARRKSKGCDLLSMLNTIS
ncbi:MAG: hypothetical protein ACTSRU_09300 [Candidatus Hodarchaeales archaeon]